MRSMIAAAALAIAVTGLAAPVSAQEMDLMQFADPNGDGKVTSEEFAAFSAQGWEFFAQGGAKVKVADVDPMAKSSFKGTTPDAGGYVTKEAYTAAVPGRFKAADTNNDGTLSKAELDAALASK